MQKEYSLCQRIKLCRASRDDRKLYLFLRMGVILTFIVILVIMKFFGALSFSSPACIKDELFTATSGWNHYLEKKQNTHVRNTLIILTSLNIDASLLFFSFLFIFYYRSMRMALWGSVFYPFRSLVQVFFGMRVPSHYLWHYPGFPSLFVPYSSGDFFYSGHVGLMLALSFEFYHYKLYWVSAITGVLNLFNAIILIVTRSHYTVDIVGGLIFSHYFYILAGYVCGWFEKRRKGFGIKQDDDPLLYQPIFDDPAKTPKVEQEPLMARVATSPLLIESKY